MGALNANSGSDRQILTLDRNRPLEGQPLARMILLAKRGIDMIAPHNPTRKRKTQDGRNLRRYRRRWRVERMFAWIMRSRRLVTRYEAKAINYLAFATRVRDHPAATALIDHVNGFSRCVLARSERAVAHEVGSACVRARGNSTRQ